MVLRVSRRLGKFPLSRTTTTTTALLLPTDRNVCQRTQSGPFRLPQGLGIMGNNGSSSSSPNIPRRSSSHYDSGSSSRSTLPSSRYSSAYYGDQGPSSPPLYAQPPPPPPKKTFQRRRSRKFSVINDNYSTVEQVQQALGDSGLESSNLIVGIDFTKSNEWTGKHSFSGRSLHALGSEPNPYEKALAIVGKTLSKFDEDNLIPCFGFGDSTTHDKDVFSFNSDHRPCEGFEEALARYRTIVPNLRLAGPTSFAPIINAAVDIVEESGGQYHVLIIIAGNCCQHKLHWLCCLWTKGDGFVDSSERAEAKFINTGYIHSEVVLVVMFDGTPKPSFRADFIVPAKLAEVGVDGQVTRSVDVADGQQSPQEQATVDAIVNASSYPLSIVLVGVGDGPWDMMREFDDNLPLRSFDNFQFVNFTAIMQRNLPALQKEASFALAALMEIPQQYRATLELEMLSKQVGRSPGVKPLLPPPKVMQRDGYPMSGYQPPQPQQQQQQGYQSRQQGYSGGHQNYGRPPSSREHYPATQHGYGGGDGGGAYEYQGYSNWGSPPSAPLSNSNSNQNPFARGNQEAPNVDCPVCLSDKKDMAFNCGHQTCRGCAESLQCCPICREPITTRIRLY